MSRPRVRDIYTAGTGAHLLRSGRPCAIQGSSKRPFVMRIFHASRRSALVDTVEALPLLDVEVRVLRTLLQTLVVTGSRPDLPADERGEL